MTKEKRFKNEEKFDAGEVYQEKQSFQRYLRESTKWQNTIMYIGAACAMILLGIFILLIQIA